jgi:hypothetical protein
MSSGLIGPTLSLSERFSAIQRQKSNLPTGIRSVAKPYDRPSKSEKVSKPLAKPTRISPRRKNVQDRLGPKSALDRLGPKSSSIQKPLSINSRLGKKK